MSTAGTPQATTVRYVVDVKRSRFTIRAFAIGMLSAFAHSPTIAVRDLQGEVKVAPGLLEDSSVRVVISASLLTVTDDINDKDRREIERRMQEEVLETNSYPDIVYECPRISSVQKLAEGLYMVSLNGELSLHGVTRNQAVSARATLQDEVLKAAGEFSVLLSDYEIKPVSAAGGSIKLKDELKLSFDITARKQS